jgi:hypothetical protein
MLGTARQPAETSELQHCQINRICALLKITSYDRRDVHNGGYARPGPKDD